jgi:hypothetical protein
MKAQILQQPVHAGMSTSAGIINNWEDNTTTAMVTSHIQWTTKILVTEKL